MPDGYPVGEGGGYLDEGDHPIAGLNVVKRWTCTRNQMIAAIQNQDESVAGQLPLPWIASLADKILARLPEAGDS